ncbi:MAG TPA: 23S rRNA (uracil(1939)-C(5))-methyltransferase RlmD [Edaphobacter sp.]
MKFLIEKIVYGGSGLARSSDGSSLFVPFTLPEETVEVGEPGIKSGYREADLLQVLDSSPARVAPRCIHFGECGGCSYQHARYEEQLALKSAILRESLERAGLAGLPKIAAHSAEPWEYRNRIRLRVAQTDGTLRAGYLRRGTNEFLPVSMCPIAAPLLWRTAEALLQLQNEAPQWFGSMTEVELFTNADETKLQMTVFVNREPAKGFAALCEALRQSVPELVGAGVLVEQNAGRNRKALRTKPGATWGADGLSYASAGESYWVSRGAFFQVNRFLLDGLVELVTLDRSGTVAWDLFAGVGLFSRVLARRFAKVVAVEAAADDLERTFRGEGRVAVRATTVEFLRQAVLERERPELVVMDPPRAGVGAEVCALLARVRPKEMVYVSCDPATLGRDLRSMVDSGYRLVELHLVDLFPQTFHQEAVAVLRRAEQ